MTAPAPPPGAFDCHTHVFGPFDRFPLAADRAYTPGPAGVAQLRTHLDALGIEHVVLVQPSPYGSDNSCLADALARLGPRARGVAVIDLGATDAELGDLHRAGVRGIRVNLHSRGNDRPISDLLPAAGERVAPLGWHVQVFADAETLLDAATTIAGMPVPVVIDHLGLLPGPGRALDGMCELLAEQHVWIKLSAPERATGSPDGPDAAAVARALLAAAPDRTVWASDWPHTDGRDRRDPLAVEPFRAVDDRAALDRLWRWCGGEQAWQAVLADNPRCLYGSSIPG
ncbi:amidohydrolase family protein [Pseudonocardia alaniniphila]|uniref:Amidohydrolase family protein n=1 Tax=Pseudonocardia alaniniphila TaxID=75291 RepID=A0ABS9TPT6_9PSEU|nr:amidohydrolase family protein [Pseudonocardia alaniniphila]MCH6170378.1 amidohydrolase family protein [Pseudonocardia alaniniphila]